MLAMTGSLAAAVLSKGHRHFRRSLPLGYVRRVFRGFHPRAG
jgi:hypothetical protein